MQISAVSSSTQNQQGLQLAANQLSSEKRITSAVVDPPALAIANQLVTQTGGFHHRASNAQDAVDETSVTSGAIATISDAAQQLYALSVTTNKGLLSASDRADLRTEANATTQEKNITANSAQFNGLPLADGSTPTTSIQTGPSEGASNSLSAAASNSADADAISTITSLMHERTKTQVQVALHVEANRAFSAVLGIIPSSEFLGRQNVQDQAVRTIDPFRHRTRVLPIAMGPSGNSAEHRTSSAAAVNGRLDVVDPGRAEDSGADA